MARRKPRKPREPTTSGRPTSSAPGSSPEGTGAGGQPQGGAPQHPGGTGGVSTGHGYGGTGPAPSASSTAAYPSATPAAPAGPSVSESSSYRRAARQQAALIQQYALNNERDRLEQKHYEFDNKNRITKQKATNEEIHADLVKARGNVKRTTARLISNKRIYAANVSGKVVGPKRIKRIDSRITTHHQEVQHKAAQLRRDAPAPMSKKESVATAKALIHEKHHPGIQESATAISPEKAAINELLPDSEKSYDIFINPKTGKPDRFSNYMPTGQKFVQALTGADPYASPGDIGHIVDVVGNAALMAASGGAAAASRATAVAKAAEKVTAAERAAAAPGFVGKAAGARTVGTAGELTGEAAAGTSRASRLAAAAKARYGAPARGARRARRGQTLTAKAFNPVVPAVGVSNTGQALVEGHLKALTEDTGETLATTKRAIYGLPGAMVQPFIDVATGHTDEAVKSLTDYAKEYGTLFSGDPEAVQETVSSELGLVPAITGVLGATAVGRAAGVRAPSFPSRSVARAEKLAHDAAYGKTPKIRDEAKRQLENVTNLGEPLGMRHGGRKRGAERAAVAAEMETGQAARESRLGGKRIGKIGPRQALEDAIGELNTKKITEYATEGDAVRFLSAHGIRADTKDVMGKLQKIRDDLRAPSKEISKETAHTRAVIDALMAHPEVLKSKKLLAVLKREEAKQYGRSVERHTERTGTRQTTPDPLDEPVRYQSIYRSEGIPQPHERAPSGYKGELKATPGQNFEKAIVEEAHDMNTRAAANRRKARDEKVKAQGAKKELNARRIADERRTAIRTKNAKVRRLEKRLAAWKDKAKKAKKPDTRKRYLAKVKELKKQIRETKATIPLAASRKRLETIRRITQHEARARELRAEAKALNEQARANVASTHRAQMQKAKQLEITAEGLRAKGRDTLAATTTARANKIRAAVQADRTRIRDEAQAEVVAAQRREGLAEPAFQREVDISDRGSPSVAAQQFAGAKAGKKERFREGVLAEEGRIDESALTLLVNSRQIRASMTERWRQRSFIQDEALSIKGRRFFHKAERTKMQEQGKVPAGYEWTPVQEYVQGVQKNDKLVAELNQAKARAIATAPKGQRDIYMLAQRSAIKQHTAQTEPLGVGWRGVRAASRLQTLGMLATSTAWFAFQFPATLLVMAARNPNPVAWARATRRMISTYRNLEPWERTNLNAHFAGNPADFLAVGENVRGIRPNTVAAMDRSMQIALGTPGGKILHAVWDNLRHGGPLIALNRKYESFQRKYMGMLEMDRLASTDRKGNIRVSARPREFIGATAKMNHLVHEDIKALKGKSYADQTRYYLDHPERMKVIEKAVNDAYGNWASLTNAEKRLASVVVFYPFVRFSLRWMFWSFPKNNPVKAAIYLNMAQKNAQELQEFLGGPPSFFSDFGKVVAHTGPGGELETVLNLGRIAPGGNALVEGLGGSQGINLQSLLRPVQPIIGIAAAALTGKDQFGQDVPDDTSGWTTFGKGVASLNPVTRTLLGPKIAPPSEWSELFRAVSTRDTGPLGALTPDLLADPRADQEAARLGRMLETATSAPTSAEVHAARTDPSVSLEDQKQMAFEYQRGKDLWAKLNGWLVAYGIRTEAELKGEDIKYEKSYKSGQRFLDKAAGEEPAKKTIDPFGGDAFGGDAFDSGAFKSFDELRGSSGGGIGGGGAGGSGKKTSGAAHPNPASLASNKAPVVADREALDKAKPGTYQTPEGDTVRKSKSGDVTLVAQAPAAPSISRTEVIAATKTGQLRPNSSIPAKRRGDLLAAAKYYDEHNAAGQLVEDPKIKGKQETLTAAKLKKAAKRSMPKVATDQIPDLNQSRDVAARVKQLAEERGLPPSVMMAQIEQESGFQAGLVSSANAYGMTQFIDSTAATYNVDNHGTSPKAIDSQLVGQAELMADNVRDYGNIETALAAYLGDPDGGQGGPEYAASIMASAEKYKALDQPAGKSQPIPQALRREAQGELGKKATKQIISETKHPEAAAAAATQAPGQWAGSQHAVLSLIPKDIRAEGRNDKRTPEENSAVGGAADSDHLTTNTKAYAADIPVDPKVYATLRNELGLEPATTGEDTVTKDGYRYQLIYGSQYGHGDHIHLGAEWVGAGVPEGTTAGGTTTGGITSTGGTSYAPSGGGGITTSGGTGIPSLTKTPKPRFSQSKLLKAIGEDQGFNQLFGGAAPPPAEEDATMAAMAEIAATRKRLLKR